jgi:hypothetical protein
LARDLESMIQTEIDLQTYARLSDDHEEGKRGLLRRGASPNSRGDDARMSKAPESCLMKHLVYKAFGPPDDLKIEAEAVPQIAHHEVLVRVRSCGA